MRYWFPLSIWILLLLFLSSTPGSAFPHLFHGADKIVHLCLYSILGFLMSRLVFHRFQPKTFRSAQLAGILFGLLYGFWDEYFQSFTPGRDVEFLDIVADVIGATVGVLVMPYYLKLRDRLLLRKKSI